MRSFATELKIGFLALLVTVATAVVILFLWHQNHDVSKQFLNEAQKISATLPILGVTEGQVAEWTEEVRKNETVKGEMDQHLTEQINKIRKGEYTVEGFNQHLLLCKKFCRVLIEKIFRANMEGISKMPHDAVFFDLDQDLVKTGYGQEVQNFARKNQKQNLFLMGRASRIGEQGYNNELSARRVKSVKAILKKSGMTEEQIKTFWLGFEAPQLTRELADLYGIDARKYDGDLFKLNQSVLLFASAPGQYFPGVVNTLQQQLTKKTPPIAKDKKVKSKKEIVTPETEKPS